ncbi:MAG: hypothetical protein ACRCT8_12920 [Lacipirellulaceae bacterium]
MSVSRIPAHAFCGAALGLAIASRLLAQPFAFNGPGLDPASVRVTTFATGLHFPVGMSALDDGSVLVAVSNGTGSFFGSTSGSIVRLVDADGDGVSESRETLVSNVPGGRLSSLDRAGNLVAVTGQGTDVPIAVYRLGATPSSPMSLVGRLNLTYPGGGGWLHPHSSLALREKPAEAGVYELYFQLGSDTNIGVTTRTVGLGGTLGLTATLAGDAVHRVELVDSGGSVTARNHTVVATGLRNATGLAFHPVSGDLYIGDNGIDGLVDPNEPTSPDEINVLPAASLGGAPENYGFPGTYQQYRTGAQVGSGGIAPLVNIQPLPSPNGFEAEGVNEIAFAPPLFPEPFAGGLFAGMHGKFSLGGIANEENPLVFVDVENASYFHAVSNAEAGVGHLDGFHSTRDTLYLSDLSPSGGLSSTAANTGVVYAIKSLVIPGDYNRDGQVDAADYTVWRDNLGQVGLGLAADGNGDFAVTAADYDVWSAAYGTGVGVSQSVPEPHAVAVAATFGSMVGFRRLSRREK